MEAFADFESSSVAKDVPEPETADFGKESPDDEDTLDARSSDSHDDVLRRRRFNLKDMAHKVRLLFHKERRPEPGSSGYHGPIILPGGRIVGPPHVVRVTEWVTKAKRDAPTATGVRHAKASPTPGADANDDFDSQSDAEDESAIDGANDDEDGAEGSDGADAAEGSDAKSVDSDGEADGEADAEADDNAGDDLDAADQDEDDIMGAESEPATSADYRPVGDGSASDQADIDADAMDYDNARAVRDQAELNDERKAKADRKAKAAQGKKMKAGKKAPGLLRRWVGSLFG